MKLQFEENEYYLMKDGEDLAIATTDESFIKELGAEMLSRKNCEAIKNDYDLEELAINHAIWDDNYITAKNSFKVGAETILEILGDKKFSEHHTRLMLVDMARFICSKEMRDAWDFDIQKFHRDRDFFIDKQIQSLQQTEWDVEVVTEPMNLDEIREQGKGFLNYNTNKPKLDAEGCLILRRKYELDN